MNKETSPLGHHARIVADLRALNERLLEDAKALTRENQRLADALADMTLKHGAAAPDAAEWRKLREHITRREAPCANAYDVVGLVDGLLGQVCGFATGVHAGEPGPRIPGCLCTHEEGDSACPVHPTCDGCGCVVCECSGGADV